MSDLNSVLQLNNTPAPVLGGKILCCSSIMVTSKWQKPLEDPANIADRRMFFLSSYWAGKEPDRDTDTSASELLIAAHFSGVIRVSDNSTSDTGYATSCRWFAPIIPTIPKQARWHPSKEEALDLMGDIWKSQRQRPRIILKNGDWSTPDLKC